MCCDSWGCKESDMTEWLNWTEQNWCFYSLGYLFSWVFRVELLDCMRNIYSSLWETAKLFSNIFVQFYITNSNVWEFQFFNIQLTLSIKTCFNFIYSYWCAITSYCGFILQFLMTKMLNIFAICTSTFLKLSVQNCFPFWSFCLTIEL